MAKRRKLSAGRMLVTLVEDGIEADRRRKQELVDLVTRYRAEKDPAKAEKLGDQVGRMIFGD